MDMISTTKIIHHEFVAYAQQLNNYKSVVQIDKNSSQIIEQLGGLHNVIQLCLTNQNSPNIIKQNNFEKLKSIINIPNDHDNKHDTVKVNNNKSNTKFKVATKQNMSLNCINNIRDWHSSSITINVDVRNNLYCKYLPKKYSEFVLNALLLNKWYFAFMTGIVAIIATIEVLSQIFFEIDIALQLTGSPLIGCSILCIFLTSYTIGANISIVFLIFQTFDFWFKVFSLIQFSFAFVFWCYYRINNDMLNDNLAYVYLQVFIVWGICFFIFIIDAILIPQSFTGLKYFLITYVTFHVFGQSLFVYFQNPTNDIFYYPFGKWRVNETRIDIKTLLISSLVNLALFIFKPVAAELFRYLINLRQRFIGNRRMSHDHDNQNDFFEQFRCGLIHKKPKIQWKNPRRKMSVEMNNVLFHMNKSYNQLSTPLLEDQTV